MDVVAYALIKQILDNLCFVLEAALFVGIYFPINQYLSPILVHDEESSC